VAKTAVRVLGRLWAKHSHLKRNVLLNLLKNRSVSNKAVYEEVVKSVSEFLGSLNTIEQLEKHAPIVALLTTHLLELKDKKVQLILLAQFFKFIVEGDSP
jgi:hypothetical protein